jgi:hypothetical protein
VGRRVGREEREGGERLSSLRGRPPETGGVWGGGAKKINKYEH